jgi:hypothetical protein
MTARATAKLIEYMRSHGFTSAHPHRPNGAPMPEKPSWDIEAGYVLRNLHALPKSGTKRPWNVRQNYFADAIDYRFDRITESMVFNRNSRPFNAKRAPINAHAAAPNGQEPSTNGQNASTNGHRTTHRA